jgi:hypothetical protein
MTFKKIVLFLLEENFDNSKKDYILGLFKTVKVYRENIPNSISKDDFKKIENKIKVYDEY